MSTSPDTVFGQTGACPLCGLSGEHRHRLHPLTINGHTDQGRATWRLLGCLLCGQLDPADTDLCPAFLHHPYPGQDG